MMQPHTQLQSETAGGPSHKILAGLVRRFETAGISEPRIKAELLLAHILNCRRLELPLHRERTLLASESGRLEEAGHRLIGGEPIQYVMGFTEFMGHRFQTDRRALIPRPETELLVETVLSESDLWKNGHPRIVDIGTGSGCIIISLALHNAQGRYFATDISESALSLAMENARLNGVEKDIRFIRSALFDEFGGIGLDAVISNPPYIAKPEWEELPREIRDHEPRTALDGGPDGLRVISTLVSQAGRNLNSRGYLFMEIGEDQAASVVKLMETAGFADTRVKRDYSGHDRIIYGRWRK